MPDLGTLCADLAAEHAVVDELVADLDDAGWSTPTPSVPWTVRHQIAHLAYFDEVAVRTVTDEDSFLQERDRALGDMAAYEASTLERGLAQTPAELLAEWRDGRSRLLEAYAGLDPKTRVEWYGPPMSAPSMVTARLMETWAHGVDVADALRVPVSASARLKHVAHIAVRALPFSYVVNGRPVPETLVHVELTAPDGSTWSWNDPAAADSVRGPALDFCLLLTRRRRLSETAVKGSGDVAMEWLDIGQAFAGPALPRR